LCFWLGLGVGLFTENSERIIIGIDRRPETKQGIEGKIDRFRSRKVRVRDRVRVRFRSPI